jgi:putative transposase
VPKRVSPCERLHAQIDEVFAGGVDLAVALERVAQLGAQLLLQAAIEGEVAAFVGRERYERSAACEHARAGMRNGHCPTTIKTTAGPVTVQRPKLRGTTERFACQLFGTGVTKTNALEALVIAGFVRGLSTRDIEATLVEALGEQAGVSRSTVSRVCEQIKTQFDAWCARRLDEVELDYPFLDGSHFKYHANAAGRAGAGRVGHRHRRQAGVRRARGGIVGVRGCRGGILDRARRARAGLSAAGHLRPPRPD